MPFETLLYDVAGTGVATITLNQPDTRNALSNELLGELIDAFEAARGDAAVRCVVLASSHDRVFSSGANLGGFAGEVPLVHKHFGSDRFVKLFRLIGELGKPSLCAAGGHVLAGSLGIALACDLVIAKEGAEVGSPLRALIDDLQERREAAKLGGGEEKIAKQHEREKLTARERLALLIDEGTFVELGIHGRPHFSQRAMDGVEAAADGVVTGYGKVDGRMVCVAAYDFTVMAGSMGMSGELKMSRLRELALQKRMPLVWLLDSAGARIQEAIGSLFAGSGHLFHEEVVN